MFKFLPLLRLRLKPARFEHMVRAALIKSACAPMMSCPGMLSTCVSCRNHPVYVLERHIGRYFALKPGTKKAGMHRGEGYYPRDALAELHTADRY